MLNALGYTTSARVEPLDSNHLPLFAAVHQHKQPHLWVVEAFDADDTREELMVLPTHPLQIEHDQDTPLKRLIDQAFFGSAPPRWILVVSLQHFILWDRTKWANHRALHIDWDTLYATSRPIRTFQLITMLLSRASLCPEAGTDSLLDDLDTHARTHAQGVSTSLKYPLREAVELLGQAYVQQHPNVHFDKATTNALTAECLRYLYRLLFLFSVEARPELNYLPMNAILYRDGFSLEKLRELARVPLHEENAAEGYFLHDTLTMLFELVFHGRREHTRQREVQEGRDTFSVAPLQCDLFDPASTPLLARIRIPNAVWQRIIRMLSLGHESGRTGGLRRISYAQLGINHLGAVYEALLSYRGFIAKEDLYEVCEAGQKTHDLLGPAYFVNRETLEAHYDESERVHKEDGSLVHHPKGTFIYRLTGRARETSASYYTPEALTRCVVKYALQTVMVDKSADELLQITICEPAMGSAAFLNEAVTQLATAYLNRKMKEREEVLPADVYAQHLQRVKLYLADNNVYGVDLNPMAVELGGVSLWLNTLVPGGFVPWFGNQLKCGNALVGAWRRVYSAPQLRAGKWWTSRPRLTASAVYHFLVGDTGMASYPGKVIKSLAHENLQHIRTWKKQFTKPYTADEVRRLQHISDRIDALWSRHVADLQRLERLTTDAFAIYPAPLNTEGAATTTRQKDQHYKDIMYGRLNTSAYQRLKLVMDYWCALWYWPVQKAHLLPTRREYISEVNMILSDRENPITALLDSHIPQRDALGHMDVAGLVHDRSRLQLVRALAHRHKFHHWPLEYADQFAERGGFDLVIGNPPWLRPRFEEKRIMSDVDPRFVLKKMSAPAVARLRNEWLQDPAHAKHYLEAYEAATGLAGFQNAMQNYPLLKGMHTNLYKSFITVAWALSTGAAGLLHPDGVCTDPKGNRLRAELYPRLRYRFQFQNALKIFPEVGGNIRFSVNIYGPPREPVQFKSMANVFDARTVGASFAHDGYGPIPGIKTSDNQWNVSGHKARLIETTGDDLAVYGALYDAPGTPALQARLPAIHCTPLASVVTKLARCPRRMRDLKAGYFTTLFWHQTNAVKDGTIKRETRFPDTVQEWILSGPHFFVGHPFYKTPRAICNTNAAYTRLDLTTLPADYRPRTNYVPACADYHDRIPCTPWGSRSTDHYRVAFRDMFQPTDTRCLIATVLPPGPGHINTVISISFQHPQELIQALQGLFTLVLEYMTKISGKTHMHEDLWGRFPVVPFNPSAAARILGLIGLTRDYADLWDTSQMSALPWSRQDPRLDPTWFEGLRQPWTSRSPLRSDYARWQAGIELDVLYAQACGLTLDELCTLYRMQFPTLQAHERNTWYDRNGHVVFSRRIGKGFLPRKRHREDTRYGIDAPQRTRNGIALGWEDVRDLQQGTITCTILDDTVPGGPVERTITAQAPFDRCDREAAYTEAWHYFQKHHTIA